MMYAPVIIPTLNRYEHFKRCLESLEKCTGAEQTVVYVGLDFPPNEKYREGWRKIDMYLKEKENNNRFSKLIVYRRDHNYGIGHTGSNWNVLVNDVSKKYDRYIASEDDNEFSPCFLEYMNKCLERFADDQRINMVCGYNFKMIYPDSFKNNFYITKNGCPWGTGHWLNKEEKIQKYFSFDFLKSIIQNDSKVILLNKRAHLGVRCIIGMIKSNEFWGDSIRYIYNALNDTYCIVPRLSMVRNFGNDGTGDHCKQKNIEQNDFYVSQPIGEDRHFEFTNDVFTYEPEYVERHNFIPKKTPYRLLRRIHSDLCFKIDFFLFRHFDYIPKSRWI